MEAAQTLVVADSAEPKSIDEMAQHGVGIIGADKGPGSLNRSIQHMQSLRITVTRRSYNLIKEYRKYFWKTDKNGELLKVPEGGFDHLLDAARYALESLKPREIQPEAPDYASNVNELIY
jgi:phage terminase large subunit